MSHRSVCTPRPRRWVSNQPATSASKSIRGPGIAVVGVGVRPRPREQPVRHPVLTQRRDRAEGVVAVAVGPARHDQRRHLDPRVAGRGPTQPHRPVVPVRTVPALAQPGVEPRLVGLEPPEPLLAPALAPHGRHGRQHAHRRHVVAVVDQIDQPQRPAPPVDVVGPTVVGRVDRADRGQAGRPLARHLQRVEARVRRAEHPDLPVAPLLSCEPRDHCGEVALLRLGVLVGRVARRRPRAPQVDPAHGVPVPVAQPDVARGVRRGEVVLAVGERLQQARLRTVGGVGQVQRRGQPLPVVDGDPHLLTDALMTAPAGRGPARREVIRWCCRPGRPWSAHRTSS